MQGGKEIAISDIQLNKHLFGGGPVISNILYDKLKRYYDILAINIGATESTHFNYLGRFFNNRDYFRKLKISGIIRDNFILRRAFSILFVRKFKKVSVLISNSDLDYLLYKKLKFDSVIIIKHGVTSNEITYKRFLKYTNKMIKKTKNYYIVALNKTEFNSLNKIFVGHVKLVYNGIQNKLEPGKLREEILNIKNKPFVLYIGRLDENQKKVSLIIRAFSMIKNEKNYLIIAGKGKDKYSYIKLANELGIINRVIFTGFVNSKEKLFLLKNCICVIQPSVNETFGLVTMEAMASGAIVLTTNNDGSRDFIKEGINGFFINPDPKSISKKINFLFKKENNFIKNIKYNAIKTSNNFTVEKMVDNYKNLINELLNG